MAIICNKHDKKYELKSEKWSCPECLKERIVKPPPGPPTTTSAKNDQTPNVSVTKIVLDRCISEQPVSPPTVCSSDSRIFGLVQKTYGPDSKRST